VLTLSLFFLVLILDFFDLLGSFYLPSTLQERGLLLVLRGLQRTYSCMLRGFCACSYCHVGNLNKCLLSFKYVCAQILACGGPCVLMLLVSCPDWSATMPACLRRTVDTMYRALQPSMYTMTVRPRLSCLASVGLLVGGFRRLCSGRVIEPKMKQLFQRKSTLSCPKEQQHDLVS
jgi:hypothetical protein